MLQKNSTEESSAEISHLVKTACSA